MADAKHPLAGYAAHGLTTTQRRYLDWLTDKTGVKVDELSFKLAVALRDQFAKSPDNKQYLAKRKEEREAAAAAVEKVRKAREARAERAAAAVDRELARKEAAADRIGTAAQDDGVLAAEARAEEADHLAAEARETAAEAEADAESLFADDEPFVPPARAPVHVPAFSDGSGHRPRAGAEPY